MMNRQVLPIQIQGKTQKLIRSPGNKALLDLKARSNDPGKSCFRSHTSRAKKLRMTSDHETSGQ